MRSNRLEFRYRRFTWGAVVALLACGGGPTDPGPEATLLRGVVVRAGTEVLLSDVPVNLDGRSVRSNDRGQYRFEGLEPGEATLTVSWPGYFPYERRVQIRQGANTYDIPLIPEAS